MISVDISKKFNLFVTEKEIKNYAQKILDLAGSENKFDLTIFIGSDQQIKNLNKQFRGLDETTDVLSFDSGEIDPETGNQILGDIAISYDSAERQSVEAGHPLLNEIILLLTHSILHLTGYDHNTPEEKIVMWKEQQRILKNIGVQINRISGDEDFHD